MLGLGELLEQLAADVPGLAGEVAPGKAQHVEDHVAQVGPFVASAVLVGVVQG